MTQNDCQIMVLTKNPYGKFDTVFCKCVLPLSLPNQMFTKNIRFYIYPLNGKKIRCVVFDGVTCRLTHLSILCLNKTMGNFMPPYEVYVLNGKKTYSHGLILFAPPVAFVTQGKKSLHLSPTPSQVKLNIAKGTIE